MIEEKYEDKKLLKRKMDFIPAIFIQKDRISQFIRDMDHYSFKDITKLKRMLADFEGDLKYHMTKKSVSNDEVKKLMAELKTLNDEINSLNIFDEPDKVVDKIIYKKEKLIMLAGYAGMMPDYVDGMPTHQR